MLIKSVAVRGKLLALDRRKFTSSASFFLDHKNVAVLGLNSSGKRTILKVVAEEFKSEKRFKVEFLNFDSHRSVIKQHGNEIVARLLGGLNESTDLVIRFGLTPIWYRRISSLSTGEIRRVLLAAAVSKNPQVLILDRPFDGLDVKSRKTLMTLLEEVSNVNTKELPMPLVQGIKWKQRKRNIIILSSHRPLVELPKTIERVIHCKALSWLDENNKGELEDKTEAIDVSEEFFADKQMFFEKHLMNGPSSSVGGGLPSTFWTFAYDSKAPLESDNNNEPPYAANDLRGIIKPIMEQEARRKSKPTNTTVLSEAVIELTNVTILPKFDASRTILDDKLNVDHEKPLLNRVSWTVHPREVWWIQGENGASKSILLNAVVESELWMNLALTQHLSREWKVEEDKDKDRRRKRPPIARSTGSIGMVSTELHISILDSNPKITVRELVKDEKMLLFVGLVGPEYFLGRRFDELSLGEQKLVLIARALSHQPRLLILDEACQSLDFWHRERIKDVINKIATSIDIDTAVLIVTHYEDELPRVVSHRLHLSGGKVLSRGPWKIV